MRESVQVEEMYHDVSEFRNFYYQTRLGRSVQRRVRERLAEFWAEEKGEMLVGFGFASPYLRPYRKSFDHLVNLMPEAQGVMAWPGQERNLSALTQEAAWPVRAGSADHILIAHALECANDPAQLLDEIWRVLAPEGKVIFLVSNRMGIWASSEATPFGYGRPYSFNQLESFLKQHRFEISRFSAALHAPPFRSRFGQKSTHFWEWALGGRARRAFGGVLVVECTKYVGVMPPMLRKKDPIFVQGGLKPAMRSIHTPRSL